MKFPFRSLKRCLQIQAARHPKLARKIVSLTALAAPFLASSGLAVAQAAEKVPVKDPEITWWAAAILGLVQGLTEFIPVSSSGHLNITHWLLGHPSRELTFDVFLHIGTTAALVWYFRHDWKALLTDKTQAKLRNLVLLGCVPAAIIGYAFRDAQDKAPLFKDVAFNATMLIVAGAILLISDKVGKKQRDISSVSLKDALIIGTAQAVALIPGVSRSGSTLTAGLFLGLQRADAARFSFLMSLPITLGAILFELRHLMQGGAQTLHATPFTMGVGVLTSAISGFWAIGFLLNYLKSRDVTPFFLWRVAVAMLVFAILYFRSQSPG